MAGEDTPRKTPLRVAIAEDSGLLRAGIVRLITEAGHRVVAEASDGPGLLRAVEEQPPDVAVVEVAGVSLPRRTRPGWGSGRSGKGPGARRGRAGSRGTRRGGVRRGL